ncbi:MAG: GGDEF domain-containing protein, partial [Desulfatitalea sp.]|nr:GGDEF domain-containing protein [Desulfatitalea sp.]NNJ99488.1 GGDEF domain-containing protein [Desulfatitalea sp.]
MKRLKGSSSAASMDAKSLLAEADLLKARCDMFQTSIAALMHFLKAFALDVAEIRSDRFKEQIQQLAERFQEAEKPKRLALEFEDEKEKILNFIECQQTYIKDRETELRDIIDLLTKAMANLNVENREFYQRINEQSEKIIEISHLDDIKRIKNALKLEVDQMREIVNLKQDQEHRQIRLLAGQVQSLQSELEQARSKAMTDGLTGIYNRQALNDYLAERIERNQVMNSDLSLMMIDIDDFKKINDKYGHLIGDRVLMAVAQKCKNAIRGDDFLARYGGEEFTIVLECA